MSEVTCPKCGGYVPGHATGTGEICTCEPITTGDKFRIAAEKTNALNMELYGQLADAKASLREHLAWALDELSGGDYSKTPKHECEFSTNPEKGHCDFCWGFWDAVGATFPDKRVPSYDEAELESTIEKGTKARANVTTEETPSELESLKAKLAIAREALKP